MRTNAARVRTPPAARRNQPARQSTLCMCMHMIMHMIMCMCMCIRHPKPKPNPARARVQVSMLDGGAFDKMEEMARILLNVRPMWTP